MVGARSAAMAFNRLVDRKFDAENPRTATRAIPAGLISVPFVVGFTIAAAAVFVLAAFELNRLTLMLSPLALAIVFFYSYTKRFTAWSHAFLGLALAVAPVGAWIAVRGDIELTPLLLGAAVVCWLVGFDTIYALQDVGFDKQAGLYSLPSRYGATKALWIARAFHALMIVCLTALGVVVHLGGWYYVGVAVSAGFIFAEHLLIKPDDLRRLNVAFFNLNIGVSLVILAATALGIYLR
jgi:4-hydroxybenzoate polyprenyltransferase